MHFKRISEILALERNTQNIFFPKAELKAAQTSCSVPLRCGAQQCGCLLCVHPDCTAGVCLAVLGGMS